MIHRGVEVSGGLFTRTVIEAAFSGFGGRFLPRDGKGGKADPAGQVAAKNAYARCRRAYRDLALAPVGSERSAEFHCAVLRALGFEPRKLRAPSRAGEDGERTAITHAHGSGRNAVPFMVADRGLDEPVRCGGARRGRRGSAHDQLQRHLNASGSGFGIALGGGSLRLLREFHHSGTKSFAGFDLVAMLALGDAEAFCAMFALCRAGMFARGDDGERPLDVLFRESRAEGVRIGRRLQAQAVDALSELASGLRSPGMGNALGDSAAARFLYRELLLTLYRILFLLFAEQRRMLPAEGLYPATYSVTALARRAEDGSYDPEEEDLWEGLKTTFRIASDGVPLIGVPAFNGMLFSSGSTPVLSAASCRNEALAAAMRALTLSSDSGVRVRVNYADMGVEELGSVYESLLDRVPARASTGGIHMVPLSTERKDLGAFYTGTDLVDFALSRSLDLLVDERLRSAGPDPRERENALLGIRLCDPACGSGAFLVGAVDRIAAALVAERSAAGTDHDLGQARRDALRCCVYGVDKDLFAVELCKVALWIHCAVADRPLSFLDHRIVHGDSLVGWPLLKVPSKLPATAYSSPAAGRAAGALGDGLSEFVSGARRLNLDAIRGQGDMFADAQLRGLHAVFPETLSADEATPSDVAAKAQAFGRFARSEDRLRLGSAADLWTAAFFWRPECGTPPTSRDYESAMAGLASADMRRAAAEIAAGFPALHWPLSFPDAAAAGGFDCVVGNPPWEQVKVSDREWFAARRPRIAAMTTAHRRAAIESLASTDPVLYARWRSELGACGRMSAWARNCGRFTPSGQEPNTYLMFAELAASLLRPGARAGILVKSAIALDRSAFAIFNGLLADGLVEEFHDFVNGGSPGSPSLFPSIDPKERFALLTLRRSGGGRRALGFKATILNTDVGRCARSELQRFTPRILKTLNPRTRTLTSFRRTEEMKVALAMHRSHPTLDFEVGGENPWEISYVRLFDSSAKSGLFLKRDELEREGFLLGQDMVFRRRHGSGRMIAQGNLFAKDQACAEALPLYEGQLANRYDHRAKTYQGYEGPRKYGISPGLPVPPDDRKADPTYEVEPRYWMRSEDALPRLQARTSGKAMIGIRDVARPWTDARCARGAILPAVPATHTLPVLALPTGSALEFLGVFNSTTFDFLVRGHMPGAHVALAWVLSQIAVPAPGLDPRVAENAAKLSLTSSSVASLFGRPAYGWDPAERLHLDVETDALVAHAFGVTAAQYRVILDSFDVLARLEHRRHGRYLFKDLCLSAYLRL